MTTSPAAEPNSAPKGATIGRALKWSTVSVLTRQAAQILAALVLARILGPEHYGIVSSATIYVTLTALLLDQGLAAALVQRQQLRPTAAGAVATANLTSGVLLGLLTLAVAGLVADFFHTPDLQGLLLVLAVTMPLKAAAISPRAMQQRRLNLKTIALSDASGAVLGSAVGIAASLLGAQYWALAWQVIVADIVTATLLLLRTRGTRPNLNLTDVRELLPFGLRIFGTNALAFMSRNMDNILVGRYLGMSALSTYAMAYRVLVIPVQLIGQTTDRVSFPAMARMLDDPTRLQDFFRKLIGRLFALSAPAMALAAVASQEAVGVVLGPEWLQTVPVLSVLAIAGARETTMSATQSLMRARGEGGLILRYEILAAATQVTGIVIGLRWGVLGVALGYTISGFLLTPILMTIQRRLAQLPFRTQLHAYLPGAHAAAWGVLAYLLVRWTGWPQLAVLVVGSLAFLGAAYLVLTRVHPGVLNKPRAKDRP